MNPSHGRSARDEQRVRSWPGIELKPKQNHPSIAAIGLPISGTAVLVLQGLLLSCNYKPPYLSRPGFKRLRLFARASQSSVQRALIELIGGSWISIAKKATQHEVVVYRVEISRILSYEPDSVEGTSDEASENTQNSLNLDLKRR